MSRQPACFGLIRLAVALVACLLAGWVCGCSRGPAVIRSDPGPAATGVRVDAEILLTFNRAMDPASVEKAVALTPAAGSLAVTFSSDGTQGVIRLEESLAPDTQYTLALDRGARDTRGAQLREQFSLYFRTAAARPVTCGSPAWSPDGSLVAWLEESEGDLSLWAAEITLTGERTLCGAPFRLADGLWPGSRAVFAPGGGKVLVVIPEPRGNATTPGLAFVDAGGSSPEPLPLNEHLEDPSRLVAAFSPDGAYLAVQNDMYMADAHSDYFRQLGVAQADGTGWTSFGNLLVGWGTDSSWLVYLDMPGIGEAHSFDYDVWRYEPGTATGHRVSGAPRINNFGGAARSPDGLFFVYADWYAEDVIGPHGPRIERLPRDLWRLSADGTSAVRLTAGQGHNSDPSVSGDGRVVFASDRGPVPGDWDLWLMDEADPSCTPVNLTARQGYDGQPVFSPGGELVAYVSDAGGNREVWLLRPDGTGRRMVSFH